MQRLLEICIVEICSTVFHAPEKKVQSARSVVPSAFFSQKSISYWSIKALTACKSQKTKRRRE